MTSVSKKAVRKLIRSVGNQINLDYRIGGKNIIVEIDESKFGKRKNHRGHTVDGVWVLGMVERTVDRKLILIPIDKRDKETLHRLINLFVKKESIIYTDKWRGYLGIETDGYKHKTVNHSLHFKDPITGVHTNTIEGTWGALKKTIPNRNKNFNQIIPYLNLFKFKRIYKDQNFRMLVRFLLYL